MLKKHVELSHTHLKYLSAPKVALYQKYLRIPTGIPEQFKENTVFFEVKSLLKIKVLQPISYFKSI